VYRAGLCADFDSYGAGFRNILEMGAVSDTLQRDVYGSSCDNLYRRLQWNQNLRPDKLEQTQSCNSKNPSRIILYSYGRVPFFAAVNTAIPLALLFLYLEEPGNFLRTDLPRH